MTDTNNNAERSAACSGSACETENDGHKWLWFFRVPGHGNMVTDFPTASVMEARRTLWATYGYKVGRNGAVRRKLTQDEYFALLRLNKDSPAAVRCYKAIQDFFFRCDPRA